MRKITSLVISSLAVGSLLSGCRMVEKVFGNMGTKHSVYFAGYEWQVKNRIERTGPGDNFFSANQNNVWVDSEGRLHLKITNRNNVWQCAEVISRKSFGYGTYKFTLAPLATPLDRNVVIGMFLWNSYAVKRHNHEIDIEFSCWGQEKNLNGQYVVHPDTVDNKYRFNFDLLKGASSHFLSWSAQSIIFTSRADESDELLTSDSNIVTWQRMGKVVPQPGREKVRLNLWLYQGQPPAEGQEIEVIVTGFTFEPLQDSSK